MVKSFTGYISTLWSSLYGWSRFWALGLGLGQAVDLYPEFGAKTGICKLDIRGSGSQFSVLGSGFLSYGLTAL